ncbi:FAD-linked oxidase C-terminal domain-containing protein [Arthrobacter sp. zg-Y820]|uniref:FAD-binding oxidoreductase n=1 Tax=unclassified Arthrobacter TaxID=235627 RepID=UPI001E42810C|nr:MULTISPECIES: FAD-linked oxidase C-terminal domain-containing protein [unclassified Arthrobacter]MCC9197202.1 FAD-binding protein [Arthrobacter sp. zg-Y820]MDK1280067.1 FAD-linked oxidase C-terminal domain-containing protein [Arthrobacter sp. zg.Y820]MDK1360795.1 FAD-linked oxidase C-terminal domain-containing protein [Arthrobacter sp. zg-Y1219]WIB09361.1 FAD-linked oxidase C-terminal domain-containing protein [Arthrobacter sp. zg-Y820]
MSLFSDSESTLDVSGPGASDALLGAAPHASRDAVHREHASTDRSGFVADTHPDGVVFAASAEDVAATLKLATAHRVPVVPRGAGTGLAGGSSARSGEVVLDVSGMNRILRIDPVEQLAVVQPGVLNAEINAAAAEYGLFYAPDPASTAICSIGGNIATNAGGMRCAKYGVTRESVLALRVILADGRELRTGRETIKGVTGYDLNALIIGSEGTLGVVVEATLRLRPLPVATATVAAFFPDVESAARAASAVVAARIQPSMMELMDGPTLEAVDAALGTNYRSRGASFLLVQTDGYGAFLEQDVVLDAVSPHAGSCSKAADDEEAAALVLARREAIPSLEKIGRVSIGDIGVPRGRLAEAVTGLEEISAATGARIFTIAHASDGNLHPMIVMDPQDSVTEGPAKEALGQMFFLANRLGGTLTGEHGVGLLKRDWVGAELGDVSLGVQHSIRRALDPLGILNPGKAL